MNFEQFVLSDSARRIPVNHPLAMSALEYYSQSYVRLASVTLQKDFLDFAFLPSANTSSNGVLQVSAKNTSDEWKPGIYQGVSNWVYPKLDIEQLIPYPIRYTSTYPAAWGYMRDWFRRIYNFYIEEDDFIVDGQLNPLTDSSWIDYSKITPRQYLVLRTTLSSRRLVNNRVMRILITDNHVLPTSLSGFANGLIHTQIRELIRRPTGIINTVET